MEPQTELQPEMGEHMQSQRKVMKRVQQQCQLKEQQTDEVHPVHEAKQQSKQSLDSRCWVVQALLEDRQVGEIFHLVLLLSR